MISQNRCQKSGSFISTMKRYSMAVVLIIYAHYQCITRVLAECEEQKQNMNCCEGYKFNFTKGECVECEDGYIGTNCSEKCPSGLYGKHCQNSCKCGLGSECHHAEGCVSSELKRENIRQTELHREETSEMTSSHSTMTTRSLLTSKMYDPSNDSGSDLKHQTVQTHHGLYAIVSANTLLTLPITVAVVVYICLKRKRRRDREEEEQIIHYHADPDPVYNTCNLTGINSDSNVDVYDALALCTEDCCGFNANCLEDVQRKARKNSPVSVRERKAKENDELASETAEYTQVKKVSRSSEDVDLGHSMTVDSLDSLSLGTNVLSTDVTSCIVPLVSERAELERWESRSPMVSTLNLPIEDSEKISIGSVVYTEIM